MAENEEGERPRNAE